jgi:hypothetical protein
VRISGIVFFALFLSGSAGAADPDACTRQDPSVLSSQAVRCQQECEKVAQKVENSLSEVAASLSKSGFKCRPLSPKSGLTCFGNLPTYPKPVAIVIPPHYQPTAKSETILFLHGNNFGRESLEDQDKRSHWGSMLADTGRNQIMIAPLSHGKTEDFEKSLATAEHFAPFQQSVADLLQKQGLTATNTIGEITLVGHSGAYRPLAAIASQGLLKDHIHEMALLDSAYGRGPEFTQFASQPGHRLWSAYNPKDGDLKETRDSMVKGLQAQGKAFFNGERTEVDPRVVQTHSVGFVPTNGDHFGAIPTYFRAFLRQPLASQPVAR